MKIAVTGARGIVGRYVVKDLMEQGYEVRAILRTPWPDCPCEKIEGVDVTNYDAFKDALSGCDGMIHLANIPCPDEADADPTVFDNNIVANYNAMLLAGQLGFKRLVVASSVCAFGYPYAHNLQLPAYLPVDEDCPSTPDNSYGIAKILTEEMGPSFVQRYPFMSIAFIRITTVFAPEMYSEINCPEILDSDLMFAHNMGTYVDARDSAAAFRLALEKPFTGSQVFYISNPDSLNRQDTREVVKRLYPTVPLKRELGPHDSLESSAKAKRVLGWEPQHNWRQEVTKQPLRTAPFGELVLDKDFLSTAKTLDQLKAYAKQEG